MYDDLSRAAVWRGFWRWFGVGMAALLLIGGLTVAMWQAGWWFTSHNATRQAQVVQDDEAYDISVTAPAYWDASMYGGKGGIHVTGSPVMPACKVKILDAAKQQAEEVCTR